MTPPRIPSLVMSGFIVDRDLEDAVLGDFAEEWTERATLDGVDEADTWYWKQTAATVPHLLRVWWRNVSWLRLLWILGIAFVLRFAMLWIMVVASLAAVLPLRTLGVEKSVITLTVLGVLALCAGLIGFAAARLNRKAPLVGVLVLGVMSQVVQLFNPALFDAAFPSRWAYFAGFSLVAAPASFVGAILSLRGRRPSRWQTNPPPVGLS